MNPERQPQLGPSPEIQPQNPNVGGENLSDHEKSGESSHEKEQNVQPGDKQAPPPPINIPLPPPTVSVPAPQAPSDDSTGPTLAADDDVIEKEWVDKAKKIIADTQNDPYKREKEIGKLQADYLKKRYGKELGVSN